MSRYINIDDISLRKTISVGGLSAKALWRRIQQEPSIDIVFCKECKHWKSDGVFTLNALGEEEQLCRWWSKFGTIRTAETNFCSYGEREGE